MKTSFTSEELTAMIKEYLKKTKGVDLNVVMTPVKKDDKSAKLDIKLVDKRLIAGMEKELTRDITLDDVKLIIGRILANNGFRIKNMSFKVGVSDTAYYGKVNRPAGPYFDGVELEVLSVIDDAIEEELSFNKINKR